eukprot:GHVP01000667.1.p1 GENE.GHVP01000667.1~~GHVP01000667.1.p1  ORF type:complete len:407 (+),score=23.60 GHVP01000667.1:981-2201(+)
MLLQDTPLQDTTDSLIQHLYELANHPILLTNPHHQSSSHYPQKNANPRPPPQHMNYLSQQRQYRPQLATNVTHSYPPPIAEPHLDNAPEVLHRSLTFLIDAALQRSQLELSREGTREKMKQEIAAHIEALHVAYEKQISVKHLLGKMVAQRTTGKEHLWQGLFPEESISYPPIHNYPSEPRPSPYRPNTTGQSRPPSQLRPFRRLPTHRPMLSLQADNLYTHKEPNTPPYREPVFHEPTYTHKSYEHTDTYPEDHICELRQANHTSRTSTPTTIFTSTLPELIDTGATHSATCSCIFPFATHNIRPTDTLKFSTFSATNLHYPIYLLDWTFPTANITISEVPIIIYPCNTSHHRRIIGTNIIFHFEIATYFTKHLFPLSASPRLLAISESPPSPNFTAPLHYRQLT